MKEPEMTLALLELFIKNTLNNENISMSDDYKSLQINRDNIKNIVPISLDEVKVTFKNEKYCIINTPQDGAELLCDRLKNEVESE